MTELVNFRNADGEITMTRNAFNKRVDEIAEVVDIDELKSMVWECNGWNGSLDWLEVYSMDEFDEIMSGVKPWDIARSIFYGGEFNPNDEYFRFNAYGNLESLSDYEVEQNIEEYTTDIIATYYDLYLQNKVDAEVSFEVQQLLDDGTHAE